MSLFRSTRWMSASTRRSFYWFFATLFFVGLFALGGLGDAAMRICGFGGFDTGQLESLLKICVLGAAGCLSGWILSALGYELAADCGKSIIPFADFGVFGFKWTGVAAGLLFAVSGGEWLFGAVAFIALAITILSDAVLVAYAHLYED